MSSRSAAYHQSAADNRKYFPWAEKVRSGSHLIITQHSEEASDSKDMELRRASGLQSPHNSNKVRSHVELTWQTEIR